MKFTVISININNKIGLEKTINSVISQTFTDYEYIVIDGGSNDGSIDVIKKYDTHINFWISEQDSGIYNAMNKAVNHSNGEYCIFMNSGDIMYTKSVLENIFRKNYKADIITGITIGKNEEDIRFSTKGEVTFLTLYRDTISHQASFIKTDLLRRYPYNENLKIVSDWEFWILTLIMKNCNHIFDDSIIAKIDLNGLSWTNEKMRDAERNIILNKYIPKRILADYVLLRYVDMELIEDIAEIRKTYRLYKLVKAFVHIMKKVSLSIRSRQTLSDNSCSRKVAK